MMRGDNIAHRQCIESEFYGLGQLQENDMRFVIQVIQKQIWHSLLLVNNG